MRTCTGSSTGGPLRGRCDIPATIAIAYTLYVKHTDTTHQQRLRTASRRL